MIYTMQNLVIDQALIKFESGRNCSFRIMKKMSLFFGRFYFYSSE